MLFFQGLGVTTKLFVNQGQVKLRNIHQLKSLGEISYIPLLTLNSVVTKATGKNICGSHILIRAQCGKVKVIDQSSDLPVFLVYFSYESLGRGNYQQALVTDKKVNKQVFYSSSTFILGINFLKQKTQFSRNIVCLFVFFFPFCLTEINL